MSKPAARQTGADRFQPMPSRMALAASLALGLCPVVLLAQSNGALPQGAQVRAGSATLLQQGQQLTVQQGSDRVVLDWTSFDIGAAAAVHFNQPSTQSVALNRVLSNQPSQILGRLSANGQVYLLNPAGVIFGRGARVDAASLVASSLELSDADFLRGQLRFGTTQAAPGAVRNAGSLNVGPGGLLALLSPDVQNLGSLSAPQGNVVLAAARVLSLDLGGDGLVRYTVSQGAVDAQVRNQGLIDAGGGQVLLSAQAADALRRSVVQQAGVIEASSLHSRGGRVWLEGDEITLQSGSRTLARGDSGGGEVLVGGGWQGHHGPQPALRVNLQPGSLVDVSATGSGDGGTAVLWSDLHRVDGLTAAHGELRANGGPLGGNGGRIETSGHAVDLAGLQVRAGTHGGRAGAWLIDPYDYTIDGSAATAISGALDGGADVTVDTAADVGAMGSNGNGASAGNITLTSTIDKMSGGDVTLTLRAHGDVVMQTGTVITASAGKLNVVLNADQDANQTGQVLLADNNSILSNGGHITLGGGAGALAAAFGPLRGVEIKGGTLDAGGGDIRITGQSTLATPGVDAGMGVWVLNGSALTGHDIRITGQGSLLAQGSVARGITIDGNSTLQGSGAIVLDGRGGGGGANSTEATGVRLEQTTVTAIGAGSITINGIGHATPGTQNYGVEMRSTTITGGATGAVTITGVGGDTPSEWNAHGISMEGTSITTSGGNISLDGTSGVTSFWSSGIVLSNGFSISAGGNGQVSITGRAVAGNADEACGLDITGGSIGSAGGAINLTGYGGSSASYMGRGVDMSDTALAPPGSGPLTVTGTAGNVTANHHEGVSLVNVTLGGVGYTQPVLFTSVGQGDVSFGGTAIITGASGAAQSFTMLSTGRVTVLDGSLIDATQGGNTKPLNTLLWSGSQGGGDGAITVQNNSRILTNGGGLWMGGGLAGGQFTPYSGGTPLQVGMGPAQAMSGLSVNGIQFGTQVGASSYSRDIILDAGSGNVSLNGQSGVASGRGVVAEASNTAQGVTLNGAEVNISGQALTPGVAGIELGQWSPLQVSADPSGLVAINASTALTLNGSSTGTGEGLHLAALSRLTAPSITLTGAAAATALAVQGELAAGIGGLTATASLSGAATSTTELLMAPSAFSSLGAVTLQAQQRNAQIDSALSASQPGAAVFVQAAGTLGLGAAGVLSAGDGNVTLVAGQRFVNANGGAALVAGGLGHQWQVWSGNPAPFSGATPDVRGGLAFDYKQYQATYGSSAVLGTGNGLLYAIAPQLTANLAGSLTKVYDGNTAIAVDSASLGGSGAVSGAVDADTATLTAFSGTGQYASKDVGTGITVTLPGLSASAVSSVATGSKPVYGYQMQLLGLSGSITPRPLQLEATKVYDGNTSLAGGVVLNGLVAGESLAVIEATALYKDVLASGNQLTTLQLADGGGGGLLSNYAVPSLAQLPVPVSITPRLLLLSATKPYDGNSQLDGVVSISGLVAGEQLAYGAALAASKDVATAGNHISAISLVDGAVGAGQGLASNYQLPPLDAAHAPVTITPLTLGLSATKVYDGNTDLSGAVRLTGLVGGEQLGYTGARAADRNASTSGNFIAAIALTDGSQGGVASNYQLPTLDASSASAVITPRPLSLSGATAADKVYDGNTSISLQLAGATLLNQVPGDELAIGATGTLTDKNVGQDKPVSVVLQGDQAGNYSLNGTGLTANVLPRPVAQWVGGNTGQWFDAANWQGGAVPDLSNVLAVSIPAGVTVSFGDSSAGAAVNLQSLSGAGSQLQFQAGHLNVGAGGLNLGALDQRDGLIRVEGAALLNTLSQTGGLLQVLGPLQVEAGFTQAGGRIEAGQQVSINTTSGTVLLGQLHLGGALRVNAGTGAVVQAPGAALRVAGSSQFNASVVNLGQAGGNQFGGPVGVSAGELVLVTQGSDLNLGATQVTGHLLIDTQGGAIGQSGLLDLPAGSMLRSGGGEIYLPNIHNRLHVGTQLLGPVRLGPQQAQAQAESQRGQDTLRAARGGMGRPDSALGDAGLVDLSAASVAAGGLATWDASTGWRLPGATAQAVAGVLTLRAEAGTATGGNEADEPAQRSLLRVFTLNPGLPPQPEHGYQVSEGAVEVQLREIDLPAPLPETPAPGSAQFSFELQPTQGEALRFRGRQVKRQLLIAPATPAARELMRWQREWVAAAGLMKLRSALGMRASALSVLFFDLR